MHRKFNFINPNAAFFILNSVTFSSEARFGGFTLMALDIDVKFTIHFINL